MEIIIVSEPIRQQDAQQMAEETYGNMVKAVVDIRRSILALGGDLHADAERLLLEDGSLQANLWGINIFPESPEDARIEYTSLINIRPRAGNRTQEIGDPGLCASVRRVVDSLIDWETADGS